MGSSDTKERILELKELLRKCNDFIKNTKKECEEELAECKADYQEACVELESAKREYREELQRAEVAGYNSNQLKTLTSMFEESITLATKRCEEAHGYLERAQADMDRFPDLLKSAKADKERFEKELFVLEEVGPKKFPLQIIGGAIIWGIIILLILKACGG